MSKKNEKKNAEKKERKPIIIDDIKKTVAKSLIVEIINHETFPKFTEETIKKIAEAKKLNEKTLKVFCSKVTKFVETISRGKLAKKKKEVSEDLKKQIIEIATETANRMASKLLKTGVTFKELLVLKKSKDSNAYGRAIVLTKNNQKEYFLNWDYKNEDLFVGSTLHEYTETIKNNDATGKKKEKKKEDKDGNK